MTLEHRRFLGATGSHRGLRGSGIFQRMGGQPAVDKLVDALYDGLTTDPDLRPLFDGDRTLERGRQKLFFAEWLGGPAHYSQVAWGGLAQRHAELPLTRPLAGHWLGHFRRALEVSLLAEEDRTLAFREAQALAFALVDAAPSDGAARHGGCLASDHPVAAATQLARRGDLGALIAIRRDYPPLLERPLHAATMLHEAARAGRLDVVCWLLDQGVSPDRPACLPVGESGASFERIIFVTPLCIARSRRRVAVVDALAGRGARDDVFTAAFLGDEPALARMLAEEPTLARAADPALDAIEVPPLHHAVAGRREHTFNLLLDRQTPPVPGADRALRGAAASGSLPMVSRLLALGTDARRLGTGRWVLDVALAPVLAAAGARVDLGWIGASCTGNQNRKDDPEYVEALLRHGASVHDRRPDSEATALHHAARAGFLRTIALLLARGADPQARDAAGETPSDWLERATKSVDRQAVRRLLTP